MSANNERVAALERDGRNLLEEVERYLLAEEEEGRRLPHLRKRFEEFRKTLETPS